MKAILAYLKTLSNPEQMKAAVAHIASAVGVLILLLTTMHVSPDIISGLQAFIVALTGGATDIALAIGAILSLGGIIASLVNTTINALSKHVEKLPGIEVNVTNPKIAPPVLVTAAENADRGSIAIDRPATNDNAKDSIAKKDAA